MNSNNKVIEWIDKRWSPRAFEDKKVEKGKLHKAFEAARRAPSSSNEQPWRFIVGEKGEGNTWEMIYSCMDDFNLLWTKFAPVLGIVVGESNFAKSGEANRHKFYDCGQAMAYLTIQATSDGLHIHQMAGFYPDKVVEVFQIPPGYEPITAFALGYAGEPTMLPEKMQAKEHFKIIRKDLSNIVFSKWEQPFSF